MRIRFFHTAGFRISAIFVAIFAVAAAVLAVSLLVTVDEEFRDQIVQFANADIAAVRDGFNTEGLREAREIIEPTHDGARRLRIFFCFSKDGKRLAGNLPPMPPRTGIFTLPGSGPHDDILGRDIPRAGALCFFGQSDLYLAHWRASILCEP